MIHTYYSNSYEALRALLIHELSSDAAGLEANEENLTRFFEAVPVIVPSRGVEADLRMAIADAFSVCSGYHFMFLSEWLGFFSKAPLANVIGNEADWILWDILRETGPGSFREEMRAKGCGRLAHYLEGKNDKEILTFARHVSQVFVVYASYRADWVMRWLGIHPELLGEESAAERRALESHPDFLWQRELWKRLAAHPQQRSRTFFAELPESLEVLARSRGKRLIRLDEHRTVRLPDALHVFVPFVVPPLMLPVVKAYAQSGRDVYLYLLNPSSEYWFDLVPRRLFDWRGSGADEHREVRHPILADNARSTRANIDRLWRFTSGSLRAEEPLQLSEALEASAESPVPTHERTFDDFNRFESDPHRIAAEWLARPKDLEAGVETEEASFYLEAHDPRLLRRVQDSILNLDPDLAAAAERDGLPLFSEEDGSLVFAAAPTPTRELEGLVDWLHAQFEKHPDLKPDEVLVATPDISATAPLIEKVFGSLPEGRRIAWKATGVRALDTDPASQALAGLAALLQGRVHRDELLAWLSMPIVAAKFGFTGEDLGILGDWLRSAGFRFGLSDRHLDSLEGETYRRVREMSLERALERLAFGFATEGEATFGDVAPVAGNESGGWTTSAERPDLLSKLGVAAARLEELRIRAAEAGEALPAVWLEWTNDVIAECFPPESADYAYDALRSAVGDLVGELEEASVGSTEPIRVAFPLFVQALTERLGGSASSGTPTNAVTFAGMSELRGIPRRIIAVIGLNEDSNFPGSSRAEEFDLMQAAPRRGDRDSRHDNRNVFLDLLLAARDAFLVSYVCGTEADEKDPSIVAKELRDWLLGFARGKAARRKAAKILTKRLPLTSFSTRNFLPSAADWQSTNRAELAAVEAADAVDRQAPELPFADGPLPDAGGSSEWRLSDLWRILNRPSEAALASIDVQLDEAEADEREGMMPEDGGLAGWSRRHAVLEALLSGASKTELVERWLLDPVQGAEGVRDWSVPQCVNQVEAIVESARTLLGDAVPIEPIEGVVEVGTSSGRTMRITGRISNLYADSTGGILHILPSVSKRDSLSNMRIYLEHAFLCALGRSTFTRIVPFLPKVESKNSDSNKKNCKKSKPSGPIEFCPISPEEAEGFFVSLLDLIERREKTPALWTGYATDENAADEILFRGRSRNSLRDALEKLFKKYVAKGDVRTFLVNFQDWCAEAGELEPPASP